MNANFDVRRYLLFIYILLIISNANAQEQNEDNTKVSVYIHPTSLLFNTWFTNAIYSTVEIPLSLSNSLIIKPSFLREDLDRSIFRLGSDIGIRHYLNGKGKGFYLQEQIGIFYYKLNRDDDCSCDVQSGECECSDTFGFFLPFPSVPLKNYLWFDVMGYFGYSWKFSYISIFADVGIGVVMGINDKSNSLSFYPLPDINIGLRVPFGSGESANAQEEPEQKRDKAKVYVYWHPVSLSFGFLAGESGQMYLMLYSTIEIPFKLNKSLIIKPSFVGELVEPSFGESREFRAGGDIGIRTYNSKKGEGFYWQRQIGIFYHDARHLFPEINGRLIWVDIMGYIGYLWKFYNASFMFTDIGLGIAHLSGLEQGSKKFGSFYIFPDINAGVGIAF
jgi:hypothetical protein